MSPRHSDLFANILMFNYVPINYYSSNYIGNVITCVINWYVPITVILE